MSKPTINELVAKLHETKANYEDQNQSIKQKLELHDEINRALDSRLRGMEQLVNLGFLIIGVTTLGVAIAFLNLVVDVYNFLRSAG